MKPKLLLRMMMVLIAGVVLAEANGLAQGFRTQQLLLDDDATSLPSRNTITLMAPTDGNLATDYGLRFPNTTNLGVGSLLFVGATGATNDLSWLAAGTTDQILQISAAGVPTWQTINLIPNGTTDNSTLRWDATTSAWLENVNLLSDATGNTTINGTATINGATTTVNSATVSVPNIPANTTDETTVIVSNGGNMETRTIDDLIDDATLSQNAVWVGDAANNPAELAAGTTDQVLQIDATGAPSWQTINLIPDGTADNTTLRWDATAGAWVENVNLTSDAAGNTDVNGTMTIDGATTTVNSATVSVPNIPANTTDETTVIVSNGGNMETRTIDDLIDDATLSQNAIWVGDAANNPAELAAGTTDQVLQIDATGAPSWQTINLIPDGTADNTTLRWDATAGAWVENVNLTSDAAGNTDVNGTMTIDGATTTVNSATTTINGATVSVPNIPANTTDETTVIVSNGGNMETRTIDDLIDDATLSQNAIWVGDAANNPAELAAGTTDQVLQIDATGAPSWQTINLIPDGTADNTTLRWDATAGAWVENVNLTSDAAGNTDVNGTMTIDGATTTVNSATVSVPNIPANATNETTVIVSNGGNMETRTIDDLIDDATLSQNAIWVGDATNNPAEVAAGTTDQVLQIDATGAPSWQTINLIPDGTADNTTLRWDATAGAWVENVNLTSDAAGNTDVNGTMTIDGATTTVNSATVSVPNIPANATNETTVIVSNGGNMETRTIDDLIDDATLSQNAIWVGDATNNPAEVAAGTTDQVLQIDATGAPSWQTINLIPDGTADNTTLRWDATAGAWVENVNLTSDAAGNTDVNGTMTIDGATTTVNSATVSVPNIPANATNETTVIVSNGGNMETRTIDDLIDDATLSQNAIWVGDATNNPAEVAAGTTNQVLQINATGTPTWQTINLAYRGRIATTGSLTQVIPDVNITAGAAVVVSYEDPANGARIAVDVIGRTAGTDFTVGFSALPPNGSYINYTVMP